jgi:hypothetical protein
MRCFVVSIAALAIAACGGTDLDENRHDVPITQPAPRRPSGSGHDSEQPVDEQQQEAESPDTQAETKTEPTEPDVDALPWQDVGLGIMSKDTQNPKGTNAALVYAGYQADLDAAKAWTLALYKADLRARGVRYIYAVQGPNTIEYTNLEIANTRLIAQLLPQVTDTTKFILLLGHSSGSYVAHEILRQLEGTRDPMEKTKGKLVYFNLDGGKDGFNAAVASYVKRAYFVSPRDATKGTSGFNDNLMQDLANAFPNVGGLLPFDASQAGCNQGATGCIHNSLVVTKPHDAAKARPDIDYEDFVNRPVTTAYIGARATEAGLNP